MTAYVTGTSTRKVDGLVRALGVESGISKSQVSRICAQLDEEVAAFRDRALDHNEFPYVFVDATYLHGRKDHRVVSRAVVVATGVAADGNREVLDLDVGNTEDEIFWTQFPPPTSQAGPSRGGVGDLRRPHRTTRTLQRRAIRRNPQLDQGITPVVDCAPPRSYSVV